MRQHGSRRVRPRLVSHGNEIPSDPELVAATLRSDRSADAAATPKGYSDADESITEILMPSDDAATTIAARDHLRCLNERRTRSERYFFYQYPSREEKRFLAVAAKLCPLLFVRCEEVTRLYYDNRLFIRYFIYSEISYW